MPLQPVLPIWGGLNTANSPSATGLVDPVTNQQYNTGGLEVGDYFDMTEKEANMVFNTTVGTCHAGRYRYVQLDSGATAANVKTGTVGYLRAGGAMGRVSNVVISAAGTGATTGTYNISATAGNGGTGATIQVVVSGGAITSAIVTNGGAGYVSAPTFSLTATSTSGGTVAAQLDSSPNVVTSFDQIAAGTSPGTVRPVVFLNAVNTTTPGTFTFVQELGLATLLAGGSITLANFVSATTGGVVTGGTTYTTATVGQAIDASASGNLFKAYLTGPVVQG